MVKMLHGDFPGTIQKEVIHTEKQIASDGTVCIIGPPVCGKTTLRNRLFESTKYLAGFASDDMSEIMDWHKNPQNSSPFYHDFSGNADEVRRTGNLVNDLLVNQALEFRLRNTASEMATSGKGHIRRLILSGVPRTIGQYETLRNIFPNLRLVGIDLNYEQGNTNRLERIKKGENRPDDAIEVFNNRWTKYYESTEPFIRWAQSKGLILMIKFKTGLALKCVHVLKHMDLSESEYTSMDKQIRNPRYDAYWSIKRIEEPAIYEEHMRGQLQLHSAGHHAPQIHMAEKFAESRKQA